MNSKQKKLMRELGCSEFEDMQLPEALNIDKKRIMQLVNDSLDAVPQERTRHMRQRRMKTIAILAAVLVLATSTVWAAANIDVLKAFFTKGDMSSLEPHIVHTEDSVSNGKFTVTLEQVIALQDRVAIIYSVEGLTKDAKEELMYESFNGRATIKYPEGSDAFHNTMSQSEMMEFNSDTKRYYSYYIGGMHNPEGLPLLFGLEIMAQDDKYIEIPMETTVEMLSLTLPVPSGEDTLVTISPIDMMIEMDLDEDFKDMFGYMDICFRMTDGSLKTINQLFQSQGSSLAYRDFQPDQNLRYNHSYIAYEVIDLAQLKSIIVGNLEYDLGDISQVTEIETPEELTPVILRTVYYNQAHKLLLKETIEALGGGITFNEDGKSGVIQYRGITLEVWPGEPTYRKDGILMTWDYDCPVIIADDGVWLTSGFLFKECLRVEYKMEFQKETVYVEGEGYISVNSVYLFP